MKGLVTILLLSSVCTTSFAQSKIKAYFNNPVNNTVSTGTDAVYLPSGHMADSIVAFINKAKYTLDIAQYDYNQSSNYGAYANIATAVNNAYTRGVTVRWIYDGSSSNTGLNLLNTAIHTLGSPTGSSYGIMHNKFIIIDANSSNAADAMISTGSEDWSSEMFYKDFNNILFIQDAPLAQAYTAEFNMMWGSTTAIPDATLSKFGASKTDLGAHTFTIDGHTVELYFSPSDNTDAHIGTSILSANKDLYVGVYDITRTGDATDIVAAKNNGVYTLALVDQYTPSSSSSVNSILSSGLGSSNYKVYATDYIYHNKMMVVDPSDVCSDPQVLTGSHNWTTSANTINDENILILHDDTLANIYYQSFVANFTSVGGTFAPVVGCTTTTNGVAQLTNDDYSITVYPNPANDVFTISYNLPAAAKTNIAVTNIIGQQIQLPVNNELQNGGEHTYTAHISMPGIYFVTFTINGSRFTKRLVIN